jgi:hypothetical protein
MKAVSEIKRDGGHDHNHQNECRSHASRSLALSEDADVKEL